MDIILQIISGVFGAALSAGAIYGAIRADIRNFARSLDEERRLREKLGKDTDQSIHDIRDRQLLPMSIKLAKLEERMTLLPLLEEIKSRLPPV